MLKHIVHEKHAQVQRDKEQQPLAELMAVIEQGTFAFSQALKETDWALIAECKLVSPAKGRLCTKYSVPELAQIYEQNGATALSVHTDPHFCGKLADIAVVRAVSSLPILRKDFIIDSYQIYEARAAGADCILLIAAVLDDDQLQSFIGIAHELGLDCLLEVHSQAELERVNQLDAGIIGMNNRDLNTFTTHIETTFKLRPYCREGRLMISESGVKTGHDAELLKNAGLTGILVGEGLVTAEDIAQQTQKFALKIKETGGKKDVQ